MQDPSTAIEPESVSPTAGGTILVAWARNLVLGHLALLVVGGAGLALTLVVGALFGLSIGSLLGLLLGVPVFLGFPIALKALVGRWLVLDVEGREHAWGYLFLLGLAGLFIVLVGSDEAGRLVWLLRADERLAGSLGEVEAGAGETILYRRSPSWRVLEEPLGVDYQVWLLGDARRVETYSLVAPLADASDGRPGCVWLGRRLGDAPTVREAQRELVADVPLWLHEPIGVEEAGYRDAIEDALSGTEGSTRPCERPVVLIGSGSLGDELAASQRRLGLLHALAHGLPMVLLAGWLMVRRVRRQAPPM
ncbi:MAG: hypothetical protein AAGC60_26280 [Acidobacteriota bacterium]